LEIHRCPRGAAASRSRTFLLSVAALYLIAEVAAALATPSRTAILSTLAPLLPPWAVFDGLPAGISPYTLYLGLVLSGLVAPIVEELYFRAYLMPRIPVAGRWAPAVNAALFAIYHFYTPWTASYLCGFSAAGLLRSPQGNVLPTSSRTPSSIPWSPPRARRLM